MKASPYLILVGILNLCAFGFLAYKIDLLERLAAESPHPARIVSAPAQPLPPASHSLDSADLLANPELKKTSDIRNLVNQMPQNAGPQELARLIAEVDEWVFSADDERTASQAIDNLIGVLRDQIEKRVAVLTAEAIAAAVESENQKAATAKLTQVTSLLGLYPVPRSAEQRLRLETITSRIASASRRVEDIRRLRYNTWAIDKIEAALTDYYRLKKTFRTNEGELIKACVDSMGVIDPTFLEPAAHDLYNYVLGLARDALSEKSKIALARGFASPATKRKTPNDPP